MNRKNEPTPQSMTDKYHYWADKDGVSISSLVVSDIQKGRRRIQEADISMREVVKTMGAEMKTDYKRITILTPANLRDRIFDTAREYRLCASDFIRIAIAEAVSKYEMPSTRESRYALLDAAILHGKEWLYEPEA